MSIKTIYKNILTILICTLSLHASSASEPENDKYFLLNYYSSGQTELFYFMSKDDFENYTNYQLGELSINQNNADVYIWNGYSGNFNQNYERFCYSKDELENFFSGDYDQTRKLGNDSAKESMKKGDFEALKKKWDKEEFVTSENVNSIQIINDINDEDNDDDMKQDIIQDTTDNKSGEDDNSDMMNNDDEDRFSVTNSNEITGNYVQYEYSDDNDVKKEIIDGTIGNINMMNDDNKGNGNQHKQMYEIKLDNSDDEGNGNQHKQMYEIKLDNDERMFDDDERMFDDDDDDDKYRVVVKRVGVLALFIFSIIVVHQYFFKKPLGNKKKI